MDRVVKILSAAGRSVEPDRIAGHGGIGSALRSIARAITSRLCADRAWADAPHSNQ